MIKEFQGEYRWLSNFAPVEIELDDVFYSSVEHAYMSAKCPDKDWKDFCSNPDVTTAEVKKRSRWVLLTNDWETKKFKVMRKCLEQKFSQEPYKTKLLNTGDVHIQEGNTWGDKIWGIDLKTGKGENHLGRIIMEIRNKLHAEENGAFRF